MPKAHLEEFSFEIDEDDDLSTELELKIENSGDGNARRGGPERVVGLIDAGATLGHPVLPRLPVIWR